MKKTTTKKPSKSASNTQALSVDALRAVVGGLTNPKEECKK